MKPFRNVWKFLGAWPFRAVLLIAGLSTFTGCVSTPPAQSKTVYQSGLNTVRLEKDPESTANTHPVTLTPTQVGSLLRGVRTWERRNVIHRLYAGEADRVRAFRDQEINALAPALSKAFAQASPTERIAFHLGYPGEEGGKVTTTGWLTVRGSQLHLTFSEVHNLLVPGPDISKYDRQMPDVRPVSPEFNVTFEPEEFLVKAISHWALTDLDQQEELQIRYEDALKVLPVQPGLDREKNS